MAILPLFLRRRLFLISTISVLVTLICLIHFSNDFGIGGFNNSGTNLYEFAQLMIGSSNRTSPCALPKLNLSGFYAEFGTSRSPPLSLNRCVKSLDHNIPTITFHCKDRLGNQMFAYATLFAIAHYNQRQAYMAPLMSIYISKYFQVSMDTLDNEVYDHTKWTARVLPAKVPSDIRALPKTDTNGRPSRIQFCCYPQAWRYFDEPRPLIRAEFKFHSEIQLRATQQLARARQTFDSKFSTAGATSVTFIGVHVRRGDYVSEQKEKNFYLPTAEYYRSAINYLFEEVKVQNPIFVVASEDVDWCRQNFGTFSNQLAFHYLEGTTSTDGGLDMAVLSNCNHVIFGLGTFGFWAGYLNPGKVVYCDNCIPKNNIWMGAYVYDGDYGNFALPSWKGIHWNGSSNHL